MLLESEVETREVRGRWRDQLLEEELRLLILLQLHLTELVSSLSHSSPGLTAVSDKYL